MHNHYSYNEKTSLALWRAFSSSSNSLDCNNRTVVKSFRRIVNFYSHKVTQSLLAIILNR